MDDSIEGEIKYLGARRVFILKQVLFNNPAYRVKYVSSLEAKGSFVVDGPYLSDRPRKVSISILLGSRSTAADNKRQQASDDSN